MDGFVAKNKDLCKFKMHTNDWDALVLVAQWLESFRSATTQMSTIKWPMLSSTHTICRGLQESLCKSLRNLPNNTLPQLKLGLLRAHRKISDNYNKIGDSPYHMWSSCAQFSFFIDVEFANLFGNSVGPTDFFQGLLSDCEDNIPLKKDLDLSQEDLHAFYVEIKC